MYSYDDILVPVDYSMHSLEAARMALDLAGRLGSRLSLLHVIDSRYVEIGMGHLVEDPAEEQERLRKIAHERMDDFVRRLGLDPAQVKTTILEGIPHREIVKHVEDTHPDLLVIGSHGRTGMQRAVLGSQSELVIRRSPIPALVVHARQENEAP